MAQIKWVNARFGDHWKENALKNYTPEAIAEIALHQGRKAIILEDALNEMLKHHPNPDFQQQVAQKILELDEIEKQDETANPNT